jgi:hypothetical protein
LGSAVFGDATGRGERLAAGLAAARLLVLRGTAEPVFARRPLFAAFVGPERVEPAPVAGDSGAAVASEAGASALLAAARRALERCGLVLGRFASTLESVGGESTRPLLCSAVLTCTSLLKVVRDSRCVLCGHGRTSTGARRSTQEDRQPVRYLRDALAWDPGEPMGL